MDGVPKIDDHFTVNIIVKQIGLRNSVVFNRLLERLTRQRIIEVCENPRRLFHARFITTANAELVKFADLHLHHRIFGFVGVACEQPSTSADTATEESLSALSIGSRRRSSTIGAGSVSIEDIRRNFDKIKEEFSTHILDSRCICLGYDEESISRHFSQREVLSFPSLEDSDELETGIREFLRAIYFVLESKRVDVSFEKLPLQETPPCPVLPEEERYRIGLENKTSKTYKRKSIGRARKQNGDYSLLTGIPQLALDTYSSAIELLKQSNDLLWLAAACEGWACAAMILRFEMGIFEETSLPRIASMTPKEMRDAQLGRSNLTVKGHQRHRSDENALPGSEDKKKSRLNFLRADRSKDPIDCTAIVERFETALENYGKFSFVAFIEYNCMMKAVSVHKMQRKYIDMETFHRDHVGKYLDDSFTRFDHLVKAAICNNSAALYKEIHFHRKSSFFARLGVLFRLHVAEGEQRTEADYRIVYPVLYRTLSGYGIVDNTRGSSSALQGPILMQIKALHEVYTAASRANLTDAAIRHICHLIQVYYDDIEPTLLARLFDDLTNLVRKKGSIPVLNQRISVGVGNIILPPIQLTRFPSISLPEICPLPAHLAPTVHKADDDAPSIFIYSPFQKKKTVDVAWVVDCPGYVSVQVYNCRNTELVVRDLCLLTEGCSFEPVPVRLILPAAGVDTLPSRINLIGVPRTPGLLKITGFSCEVLELKNVCKLESATGGPLTVSVLPAQAVLKLESSLPRAPFEDDQQETSSETTVYSGQIFEHRLIVKNESELAVRKARLQVWQPKVSGGPSLIELMDDSPESFSLEPGERKEIRFKIFGIDPTATADDESGEEKLVETALPLASTAVEDAEGAHDLIPYTGRLLTCQFAVHYESDVNGDEGERYERIGKMSLAVCIVPALTVSAWHVLQGDGPFSRYIVVDVTNSTEHDAELVYSSNRRMNVLPKETCRVPLHSPCCSDVAGRAFYTATQKDSHVMQRLEVEKLRRTLERHVSKHLDIRWSIPTMELDGLVPVGALLSSVSLLKQLVLPAISLDIRVNSSPYISEDDIAVPIKDIVCVNFKVISSLDYDFEGVMSLDCYQEISQQFEMVDRSDSLCFVSQKKVPFVLPKNPTNGGEPSGPSTEIHFRFFFRAEGIHKIRPIIVSRNASDALFSDEVFVSSISFSVYTKVH